jgi:hypothetical protein
MALPTVKLDVCNLSLDRIGEKAITSAQLTADTDPRAQACNRHYEQNRDALQRSHWWRFARDRINLVSAWATGTVYTTDQYVSNNDVFYKCLVAHTSGDLDDEPGVGAVAGTFWTTLTSVDYVPDSEWDFEWTLPADYLRFRSIFEETGVTSKKRRHALEGQKLLTNLSEVSLLYIKQITDVTKFDSLYIEVLVLQLALKLIPARAGAGSASLALSAEIKNELKPLMAQVRAIDNNETDVGGRSDWILARSGGLGIMTGEERFL